MCKEKLGSIRCGGQYAGPFLGNTLSWTHVFRVKHQGTNDTNGFHPWKEKCAALYFDATSALILMFYHNLIRAY